ncbi:MAG: hypothetical protein ABEK75_11170 [Salinibacter sp.]
MKRRIRLTAVLAVATTALLLVGCDLFIDPPPYEISVERPRQNDTLVVGTPFRVKARLEGDRTIQSAEVIIYRNLGRPEQDTVFIAPLPVPPNRKTLHVDTTLTMERLSGPPGSNFDVLVSLQMKDRGGGSGPDVTILESGD